MSSVTSPDSWEADEQSGPDRRGAGGANHVAKFHLFYSPASSSRERGVLSIDGLVGESGCGKSTTSAMVMRLIDKSAGTIVFDVLNSDLAMVCGIAISQPLVMRSNTALCRRAG
jgi:ABC transporter